MRITTQFKRGDAVRLSLLLALRSPSLYVWPALIGALPAAFMIWMSGWPLMPLGWFVLGKLTAAAAAVLWLLALTLVAIRAWHHAARTPGLIGDHTFDLTTDGLCCRDEAERSTIAWTGISAIRTLGPFLVFHRSPTLALAVPRRAFGHASEFADFATAAVMLWRRQTGAADNVRHFPAQGLRPRHGLG